MRTVVLTILFALTAFLLAGFAAAHAVAPCQPYDVQCLRNCMPRVEGGVKDPHLVPVNC